MEATPNLDSLYKYPRTSHVRWSTNREKKDKTLKDTFAFYTKKMLATLKMDGECTTMYPGYIHARSLDSGLASIKKVKESRSYVKQLWGSIKHNIPENYRICGENLYAKHSIYYDNLENYFLVFSIWDKDVCLSWNDTVVICNELGLATVQVIDEFTWQESKAKQIAQEVVKNDDHEGVVFRNKDFFKLDKFDENVCKYVRDNHVRTGVHWVFEPMVFNRLKRDANNK